jgi:hypothetical protein
MAIFRIESTQDTLSNGRAITTPADTPALAVLFRAVDGEMDPAKMTTHGSAVLFRNKRIAVTSFHVDHYLNFEGSGLVYSPKGGVAVIQDAVSDEELQLKVLILKSDVNVTPCGAEDLGNPITSPTPPPVPIRIQGYGGNGVDPISKPPLLRELKAKATHPKDGDGNYEKDLFGYAPEREFVVEELNTQRVDPDGMPIPPILDEGDSGSAALTESEKNPPVCYGLLDRVKDFGTVKIAVFARFDKKAVDWIRYIAKLYGITIPE